jgi:hypothetical protein
MLAVKAGPRTLTRGASELLRIGSNYSPGRSAPQESAESANLLSGWALWRGHAPLRLFLVMGRRSLPEPLFLTAQEAA